MLPIDLRSALRKGSQSTHSLTENSNSLSIPVRSIVGERSRSAPCSPTRTRCTRSSRTLSHGVAADTALAATCARPAVAIAALGRSEVDSSTAAEAGTATQPDNPQCRICLDSDEAEQLFMPCNCKGTSAFVHRSCLQQWRSSSQNSSSYYKCDQCQAEYDIRRTIVADMLAASWLPHMLTPMLLCYCTAFASYMVPRPLLFEHLDIIALLRSVVGEAIFAWVLPMLWGAVIVGVLVFVACVVDAVVLNGFDFFSDCALPYLKFYIELYTMVITIIVFGMALTTNSNVVGVLIAIAVSCVMDKVPCKAQIGLSFLFSAIVAYSGSSVSSTDVLQLLMINVALNHGVHGFHAGIEYVFDTLTGLCRSILLRMEKHVLDVGERMPVDKKKRRNQRIRTLGVVVVMGLLVVVLPTHVLIRIATMPMFPLQPGIEEVSPIQFDAAYLQAQGKPVITLWFFRDDSPEDQAFQEEYMAFARQMEDFVKPTAINCNKWEQFCKANKVQLTPVLKIHVPGRGLEEKLPYRTTKVSTLVRKVKQLIPDNTVHLQNKWSVDKFFDTHPSKLKVVLFSSKTSPPLLLKGLSSQPGFQHDVTFGFATEQSPKIVRGLKVQTFPTLIAWTEDRRQYEGELSLPAITRWVHSLLLNRPQSLLG